MIKLFISVSFWLKTQDSIYLSQIIKCSGSSTSVYTYKHSSCVCHFLHALSWLLVILLMELLTKVYFIALGGNFWRSKAAYRVAYRAAYRRQICELIWSDFRTPSESFQDQSKITTPSKLPVSFQKTSWTFRNCNESEKKHKPVGKLLGTFQNFDKLELLCCANALLLAYTNEKCTLLEQSR